VIIVSVRTARRQSNYNSVIPAPEPLNTAPNMHPLKRKFEPVLLDRYPQRDVPDESAQRGMFPDYVPMFAFPNDINVVSSDSRPRSTWHGFSMTSADNSRLHAICVIVWIPMSRKIAEELEKRCEEWRRANMSEAERELAASLGERLAQERANLSRLLSQLGLVQSGSAAREELDERISAVEEKIHMMTDMLRPLRHGAASKIEGLTDGETGLWIPRAYGILGKDSSLTSFWKEWLRAVVVPMSDGSILRIPPSSPKAGMWQPLESYVINLCTEAPSPISSKTQVELTIRELRLFARKEAINELPGSRNTDLYPLFRALTIPNIMILFEYVLAESRIILLSSHTAMLHTVSNALIELIWPLKWAGVFIPVLPARLVQAVEAPCPYICGVERRYENFQLPDDDFVLVDLDNNEIESTASPPPMPRQQRRKLVSLLQLAAPHHHRFGVPIGPPPYVVESFPGNAFCSENSSVFSPNAQSTSLSKLVGITSTSFGAQPAADSPRRGLVLNAFLQAKNTRSRGGTGDYPRAASVSRTENADSPPITPVSTIFPQLPLTPASRNDSGYALQATLREKRSGHFDSLSKHSGSIGKRVNRKPSLPFLGHSANESVSTAPEMRDMRTGTSTYAPSAYAQSTIAASTIMSGMLMQPVRNTENQSWVEGHCLQWRPNDGRCICSICDEKADEGFYRCAGCGTIVHGRCAHELFIVCPSAFYPEQLRAAFARCFASLFYTYRKYMQAPTADQRKNGMVYQFKMNDFLRSLPHENADYIAVLQQTQGKN
jgi:DENN (AEX-3) domain/uDENN domain